MSPITTRPRIEPKPNAIPAASFSERSESRRRKRRNGRPPFADGGFNDVEFAGDRDLRTEIADGVGGKHGREPYRMRDRMANYARQDAGLDCVPVVARNSKTVIQVSGGSSPQREIGARIKLLREAKGLSQSGLAELLVAMGASPKTGKSIVSKWELGEIENIANATLYFLTKALGTSHEYLLFGPAGPPKPRADFLAEKHRGRR